MCTMHSPFPLIHFWTSCDPLLWSAARQVVEAEGADGILDETKVSQAIFAGGLIV